MRLSRRQARRLIIATLERRDAAELAAARKRRPGADVQLASRVMIVRHEAADV